MHYVQNNHTQQGLLALFGHSKLTKAVEAFHHSPEQKWGLSTLAKEAAMSRTSFVNTFKKLSGWTVNQYKIWWRLQLAWEKLSQGDKVNDVALEVGYQSEAAFSRAFYQAISAPS